jgi:hypothetical protein
MSEPDDHGKKALIIEQWWVGFSLLIFWAVAIILILTTKCTQ